MVLSRRQLRPSENAGDLELRVLSHTYFKISAWKSVFPSSLPGRPAIHSHINNHSLPSNSLLSGHNPGAGRGQPDCGHKSRHDLQTDMAPISDLVNLAARQVAVDGTDANTDTAADSCVTGNEYDGRLGLRIAAIFIIWFGATVGACFPVFARANPWLKVPEWTFFVAKYFGSGVIIATAFIHLLSPAEDALRNPCLTGPITEYDWVSGIVLITIFVMFVLEFMVMRYGNFGSFHEHAHEHSGHVVDGSVDNESQYQDKGKAMVSSNRPPQIHQPGVDHLGHRRSHTDIEHANDSYSIEDYNAQLTAIFILEFGVIFHSIFIGLTLAVAGSEFVTLFIVLVFHQTFEGLGLGSRLAVTPWPASKTWTPYLLGIAYGLSTPIAIAVGLGVRKSYPPEGRTTLLVNGVFDSVSAGILIYTGLVELMAHEFMFSSYMQKAPIKIVLAAIFLMGLGAALMALLGKWA